MNQDSKLHLPRHVEDYLATSITVKPNGTLPSSDVKKSLNKPLWAGKSNVWWLFCSLISIYFTLGVGIPLLFRKGMTPFFSIHLINATLISLQCILNLYFTPSMGPAYKKFHRNCGTISIVFGILSTLMGYVTTWYERYDGRLIFNLAITIGGTGQVVCQLLSVNSIRKGDVKRHITYNHYVFYGGCIVPAFIRMPLMLNMDLGPFWPVLAWVFPSIIIRLALKATINRRWY